MLYLRDSNCNKKKKKYWNKMKRRFVYKRDYSFAYNGNINFVLKILTNAALSEGRHSILVPCFFFFSLPKRLPAAALQGWNSFGEVVGKRMKSALSWEMEHGIRERMHFLTGIPAGNAVLWSLPKVQPRRASLLARRTRREKGIVSSRARTISINRCVVSGYVCSFPFFFFPIDRMADRTGRFGRVETGDDTFEI